MMLLKEIENNDVGIIYQRLGSIVSILSQVSTKISLTNFDVTNKILPAIRHKSCCIMYNKNGHPISFIIWKKFDSNDLVSLDNACREWHPLLGWNEGEDYLITHFFSNKMYVIDSIRMLKKKIFKKGDRVYYFNLRNKITRKTI
ncbi:RTX toxin-activating lysine-acyltransferase [Vibrio crassostreae]|nr:hemolysin-activating ACP:hemolysin acyltransferase [Vibrio crassostreae]CAK2509976.1 RTX toxin-activating lysine-acyltransferase [Vibrio crassostreae]CAK2520578.1 RTX toxin-activating lysine-acyltransferase [Vibrio crassostreae]CAK3859510.1 RTX toxin-activating lysine-acyltransferase [Vibrio crassostreae]CAK4006472.1 RTX toxin-activating lysine-acyltransferase [Vibrio crassostreae]